MSLPQLDNTPDTKYGGIYMSVYALLTWIGSATMFIGYADFFLKCISCGFTITVSLFAIKYYKKSIKKIDNDNRKNKERIN